jgi:Zn-dependent M28 family amino/carboxypeptidase
MTRLILRLALALAAGVAMSAEELHVDLATRELVHSRLEAGQVAHELRQSTIARLFADAGCIVTEQKVFRKTANVICTLPGESPATIAVGGHFDYVRLGRGIVDDWSGTALLPSLFAALSGTPRKHTYVFIAFSDEETGLEGSSLYVKRLTEDQRRNIHAFVNLECLGLGEPNVWTSRADKNLLLRLNQLANAMRLQINGVSVDKVGDDDSHPFIRQKIPVITIHSITQHTLEILHSPADGLAAIQTDLYYKTYRLAALYLAYLDLKLE